MEEFTIEAAWFIGALLVASLSAVLFRHLKLSGDKLVEALGAEVGYELRNAARFATAAAEQLMAKHGLAKTDALEYAVGIIDKYLAVRGIEMPEEVVIAAIESHLWEVKNPE